MTPAMIRARKPFFWKNAAAFVVLGSIATGIYFYTYSFLEKDDFSDVPVPPISDEELEQLRQEYHQSLKQKK